MQVAADITPMSANKVAVRFTQFKILGLIPITAPEDATGAKGGELKPRWLWVVWPTGSRCGVVAYANLKKRLRQGETS